MLREPKVKMAEPNVEMAGPKVKRLKCQSDFGFANQSWKLKSQNIGLSTLLLRIAPNNQSWIPKLK